MMEKQVKVTISLPIQVKHEVEKLKYNLKVSMNKIYQNAIQEYIKQKKREKLRQEAQEMLDEYKNNPEMLELANFEEDIVEY